MFIYQGIFLAATISSASVVFADVLVQPGYHYNNQHNPSYQHAVSQHTEPLLPADQYNENQVVNQQPMQHTKEIQTVYPYYGYQDYDQSPFVGYPLYHHHHHHHRRPFYLPHQWHYSKIGGHGYYRPSIFVRYSQPMVEHYRYKRSAAQDATMEKFGEPTFVKHEDDVATKPPLTATKYSTVIDSNLQKNEPIDNDKKSSEENRQSKDDRAAIGPVLFGLYPENMYRNSRQSNFNPSPTKINIQPKISESVTKPTADFTTTKKTTPAAAQGTKPEENSKAQQLNQIYVANSNQPASPSSTSSSSKELSEGSELVGAPYGAINNDYYGVTYEWPITMSPSIYTPSRYETWNWPNTYYTTYPRYTSDTTPSYTSWKFEPQYQQNAYQAPDKKSSLKLRSRNNKERSRVNQLIFASNTDNYYRPATSCNPSNYYPEYPSIYQVTPIEAYNTYEPITNTIDPDYYATYKASDIQSNPATSLVETSPYKPQISQLSSNLYNTLTNTRYFALPQTYNFNPALTYGSAPFEGTFSSPTYY